MNGNEKLAVLTALKKLVNSELAKVREECDENLLEAYDRDGVSKVALKVNGIKVGDFLITFNSNEWEVTDNAALGEFALEYGFATVERTIKPEYMSRAVELLAEEEPDGIAEMVKVDPKWPDYLSADGTYLDSGLKVPGVTYTGRTVKNTQVLKCDPNTVAPILRQMGGIEMLLLDGGSDD